MFCEKCGVALNENGLCPDCDVQQFVQEEIPPVAVAQKGISLKKCIWFVPVTAVLLSVFLSLIDLLTSWFYPVVNNLLNRVLDFDSIVQSSNITNGIVYFISSLLTIGIVLLFSFGLYAIAFRKDFKKYIPIAFLPYASYGLASFSVSVFQNTIDGVLRFLLYEKILASDVYPVISHITFFVSAFVKLVIAVVIATLIASTYLKKVNEEPIQIKKAKPLTKSIWFAPVTTGLLSILFFLGTTIMSVISSAITTLIASLDYELYKLTHIISGLSNSISNTISILIILLVSLGLYALAFKKRFKNHIALAFVPYACYAIANLFITACNNVFNFVVNSIGLLLDLDEDITTIVSMVSLILTGFGGSAVVMVLAIIIASVIAVTYLKKAEARRKEAEEIQEEYIEYAEEIQEEYTENAEVIE